MSDAKADRELKDAIDNAQHARVLAKCQELLPDDKLEEQVRSYVRDFFRGTQWNDSKFAHIVFHELDRRTRLLIADKLDEFLQGQDVQAAMRETLTKVLEEQSGKVVGRILEAAIIGVLRSATLDIRSGL